MRASYPAIRPFGCRSLGRAPRIDRAVRRRETILAGPSAAQARPASPAPDRDTGDALEAEMPRCADGARAYHPTGALDESGPELAISHKLR